MKANIVSKEKVKTQIVQDGVLNVDTLHLTTKMAITYDVYKYWKKGKGGERVRTVSSELGSIKLVYTHYKDVGYLRVDLSLTKLLYGNNFNPFDWARLPEAVARINCIVSAELGIPDVDINDFAVKRLDLNIDHCFPCEEASENQMDMVTDYFFIPSTNEKERIESTYYIYSCKPGSKDKSKSAVFKYYRKDREIIARMKKGCSFVGYIPPFPCIRYELTLPTSKLQRILDKDFVTLKDIKADNVQVIFSKGLEMIGGDIDKEILTKASIRAEKKSMLNHGLHCSRPNMIEYFFDAICKHDIRSASSYKLLMKTLRSDGYQLLYNDCFRNFCRPKLLLFRQIVDSYDNNIVQELHNFQNVPIRRTK